MNRMLKIAAAVAVASISAQALANSPKDAIAALDARLAKLGPAKVEGVAKVADADRPALFFGARRINSNYDVVDEIKRSTGASATVFVKDGDEFVRVSTKVLTAAGARGVSTNLARAKAYEALMAGNSFCGTVDVLGTAFDACYNPLKDTGGLVIGATYVGFKK